MDIFDMVASGLPIPASRAGEVIDEARELRRIVGSLQERNQLIKTALYATRDELAEVRAELEAVKNSRKAWASAAAEANRQ